MSIAVFGWRLALGSRVGARAEGSDCGVAGVQVEEKQRQMGLGLGTGNWSWELKRTMDRGHFCIFSNGIWKSCRRQRGSDEGGKAEKKARRAREGEIADFSDRFFAKILRLQRCKSMQIL